MDFQERIICRLCLKACDSFKGIKGEFKDALNMVLKEIDMTVIQEPMMCTYCAAMLIKCSRFKTTCLAARDCILPSINNKDADHKLNLKELYLGMSENDISLLATRDICGLCMSPVESCSAISFDVEWGDVIFQNMIEECLPELDFSVIKKPVICPPCHEALESCFCFVTNYSIVEETIRKYRETQDMNGTGQMELSGLLEFMARDAIRKVEKEETDEEEIGSGGDVIKVEPMFLDANEGVKDDLEIETELDCMAKNMLTYGKGTKIEKMFSGESEFKEENVDAVYQLTEEIVIKTEECNFNRSENDVQPLPEVATVLRFQQKCLTPDVEEDLPKSHVKQMIKSRSGVCADLPTHKYPSEVTMYKCDTCLYQTTRKNRLKMHLLTHKDPSEVTMYKCSVCSFQTKLKSSIKRHMLKHMDPSEVTMYTCSLCSFQAKLKSSLKRHMLKHTDPSEVTMYKCDICLYQTKYKNYLKEHLLKHKDPSEVTMYKCSLCSFQTKLEKRLQRHLLAHKDPSEITMYKCHSCLFQTKCKHRLTSHLLKHQDSSEVTLYKCDSCSYQTRRKQRLESHLLTHTNKSEEIMYKCDSCSFQANRKRNLKNHLLKHKDPSEVTMYKCSICSFQTKRKRCLKVHLLVHNNPLEVTMYKCDSCLFQTKYKHKLKEHLLKHKDPSEVTVYKCDSCSFQTKYKQNVKIHSLIHKK